ncbi:hypothetical protein OPQ81_001759 [Rhizoctonia solani]|nr:hypothetical protein OPQ81_001759 [Rhizoctonia solani]
MSSTPGGGKYPGMGSAEVPSAVGATPAATSAFGTSTTPAGVPAFGVPAYGTSTTPAKPSLFGQSSTTPAFGQPSTTPAATPAFGQTSATAFGKPSAFGTTSTFVSSSFGANNVGGFGKFTSTTPAGAPSGGGFAGFGAKPVTFGSSAPTTSIFGSVSETTTPKTESPLSGFGSSAFGGGTSATTPKSAFGGFGSSASSVSSPVKPRDGSVDPESPPPAAKPPIEISPPGSPAARSDSGIDVGDLNIGGAGKKPPAGLDASDDESEHDPTETPSKPPASTSGFAGFGKPSAFGTATTGGAFAAKPATTGAFGLASGTSFGSAKPASGFGAFGAKAAAPSTGFSFGGGDAKKDEKPAFAGGSAFGSSAFGSSGSSTPTFGSSTFGSSTSGTPTSTFGSTAFGSGTSGSSAPAFGATSKPGSGFGAAPAFGTTSAPTFGASSAFGAPAKPADSGAPKTGGFSAFAAPKPGETKVTGGGFAGFGDATKNKGGFLGFGDNAEKKNIFAEPAKLEEKKEEPKQESTPKDTTESKPEPKPETPKSAFSGLVASSPPPKPQTQSPAPEATKPAGDTPSKIPVPKSSLLDRLSPRPEPQEPAEPEPSKPESSTPPGSPSPSPLASPPVTRENEDKPSNEAPIKPPALAPKTSSDNLTKPASTGFFGFEKPTATEEKKETKPPAEQSPGAMKGAGGPSATVGSPTVANTSTPAAATAPSAKPLSLYSGTAAPLSLFSGAKPLAVTAPSPAPTASSAKPSFFAAPAPAPAAAPPSTNSPFAGFGAKPGTSPFSVPTEPSSSNAPTLSNVELEFNRLLEQMSAELGKLRQETAMLQYHHLQVSRANIPAPVTVQKTEDPSKWGLGDLAALKQVTGLVTKEVEGLKGLNKDFIAQMTELQPGAEKVQAKRNEIARYLKAKKDPKYTRLLKSRTSSPEHIENQTKLRKTLQIVRERTRQLEDFMATQRSRIQKQKEGRREFKVPSIDTINRTMRNINSALAQKSEEITDLTARVDRLKLKAPRRKASLNMGPLALPPAENEKIKLASAAALNMERSSIRLKNALLQARTETPLNTTAVGAPVEEKPRALARVMPPKPSVPPTPAASVLLPAIPPATPAPAPAPSLPVFSQPPATPNPFAPKAPTIPAKTPPPAGGFTFAPITPVAMPAFTPLGKDEFHVTAGYEHSGRRSEKSRMHGSSVKLKTPSPNLSRTTSEVSTSSPLPAPALAPTITPAKSFFGVNSASNTTSTAAASTAATTTTSTGRKTTPVPAGFFSFSAPSGGPVASTPPPPPKGFNFFQTPAQKAATTSTTPVIPPIPSWGTPNSSISSTTSNGSAKSRDKDNEEEEEEEEGSEGHSGEEDEDEEDWIPGDEDEEEEDEDDVSDGVPEGDEDDEDQTARI